MTAATIVASGANWTLTRTVPLAAGTYTVVVTSKRNTGSDDTFLIRTPAGLSAAKTAWSAYGREAYTFTTVGGTIYYGIINNWTAASLQVESIELFSGAVDLGPETENSHLSLGVSAAETAVSMSGGVLNMTANGAFGRVTLPASLTLSRVTVVTLARKTAGSSGYVAARAKTGGAYNTFGAYLERGNLPDFGYNCTVVSTNTGANIQAGWDFNGKGWHCFAHRYDGAAKTLWVNGGTVFRQNGAQAAPTIQDLWFSSIDGAAYG